MSINKQTNNQTHKRSKLSVYSDNFRLLADRLSALLGLGLDSRHPQPRLPLLAVDCEPLVPFVHSQPPAILLSAKSTHGVKGRSSKKGRCGKPFGLRKKEISMILSELHTDKRLFMYDFCCFLLFFCCFFVLMKKCFVSRRRRR